MERERERGGGGGGGGGENLSKIYNRELNKLFSCPMHPRTYDFGSMYMYMCICVCTYVYAHVYDGSREQQTGEDCKSFCCKHIYQSCPTLDVAENKPEEGSVAVNKQRDRIETTNAIRKATEMADHGR